MGGHPVRVRDRPVRLPADGRTPRAGGRATVAQLHTPRGAERLDVAWLRTSLGEYGSSGGVVVTGRLGHEPMGVLHVPWCEPGGTTAEEPLPMPVEARTRGEAPHTGWTTAETCQGRPRTLSPGGETGRTAQRHRRVRRVPTSVVHPPRGAHHHTCRGARETARACQPLGHGDGNTATNGRLTSGGSARPVRGRSNPMRGQRVVPDVASDVVHCDLGRPLARGPSTFSPSLPIAVYHIDAVYSDNTLDNGGGSPVRPISSAWPNARSCAPMPRRCAIGA